MTSSSRESSSVLGPGRALQSSRAPSLHLTSAPTPRAVTLSAAPPGRRSCPSRHCMMRLLRGPALKRDPLMTPPRFARNLSAVLLWELMWGFGNACTSSAIFVPFLSHLAGSKRLVGTVGLTMLLGLPALIVSLWLAHRLRRGRLGGGLLWAAQG